MNRIFIFFSLLLMLNYCDAAIHYTLVNEEILTARYYDIDNNGDNNFEFSYDGSHGTYAVTPSDTFNFPAIDAQYKAKAYGSGAGMGTYTWTNQYLGSLIGASLELFLQTEKYLMVKFMVGTNAYYGWVLLSNTNANYNMFVVSYAYNDVPNQPITAGEMTTGIEDITASTFNIYLQNGIIEILNQGNYTATVSNLAGQTVLKQQVISGKIDAAMLPRGIYIVTLTDEKGKLMNSKIVL